MGNVDTLPYSVFKRLKAKYPVVTILVTDDDIFKYQTLHKSHRDLVAMLFKEKHIEVTRWAHKYSTLESANPELGLVYMINDSSIVPALEVHALVGHNARGIDSAG